MTVRAKFDSASPLFQQLELITTSLQFRDEIKVDSPASQHDVWVTVVRQPACQNVQ